MTKRKICVVTGTRAEYGLLRPVMEKIKKSNNLELQTLVTGMHLLSEFGHTIDEIKKDGFKIDATVQISTSKEDNETSMTLSIGKGIIGVVRALVKLKPDIVIILGDRFEALASAIAASYSGRIVAHMFGGDKLWSGYDEYTRPAITKISHIHFPTTKKSAERVEKLGEKKKYIFRVGSPALDTILNKKYSKREEVCKRYDLDPEKPYVLLVQHPLSVNPKDSENEIKGTLEAIVELGLQTVIIYPNSDPGGRRMIRVIKKFERKHRDLFRGFESLPFDEYLDVMKNADVMVGNSSSGIMESPSFKLPVVNIGIRQEERERAKNVIDVPHEKNRIKRATQKALCDKKFREKVRKCKSPYGDGRTSEKIVKVLSKIKDKELSELKNKKITYE